MLFQKYLKGSRGLWDKPSPSASPTWKGICKGLDVIKEGVIWRVGNGGKVRFWLDKWLIDCPLIHLVSGDIPLERLRDLVDYYWTSKNDWNWSLLVPLLPPEIILVLKSCMVWKKENKLDRFI